MLSAGLYAVFGRVPFPTVITVLDALLVVFTLACAGWTLIQTRNLRNGFRPTTPKAIAKHRRLLAVSGWPLVIIGGVSVLFRFFDVGDGESIEMLRLFGALALLIWGVVSVWCRHILDSPQRATETAP